MAVRVSITKSRFAISKPGASAANTGTPDSDLHMNLDSRHAQVLDADTVGLDASFKAAISYGPYDATPDITYNVIDTQGVMHDPPCQYLDNGKTFVPFGSGNITMSTSSASIQLSRFGATADGDVPANPGRVQYFVFRRGSLS